MARFSERARGRVQYRRTALLATLANAAMMTAGILATAVAGHGLLALPRAVATGVYGAGAATPSGFALAVTGGIAVHVAVALALGAVFATLVNVFTHEFTLTGIGFGAALWIVDETVVAAGVPPMRAALAATTPVIAAMTHVAFGLTLATLARFTVVPRPGSLRA